ncbi:MAG: hypothetical protein U0798_08445 [Gemmataceae bacterium]
MDSTSSQAFSSRNVGTNKPDGHSNLASRGYPRSHAENGPGLAEQKPWAKGKNTGLVKPILNGAKAFQGKDSLWTIEIDVRDQCLGTTFGMTEPHVDADLERMILDTKRGMTSRASDPLENGRKHGLIPVHISAHTPVLVKQPDGKCNEY